jgi:hypothetical protein
MDLLHNTLCNESTHVFILLVCIRIIWSNVGDKTANTAITCSRSTQYFLILSACSHLNTLSAILINDNLSWSCFSYHAARQPQSLKPPSVFCFKYPNVSCCVKIQMVERQTQITCTFCTKTMSTLNVLNLELFNYFRVFNIHCIFRITDNVKIQLLHGIFPDISNRWSTNLDAWSTIITDFTGRQAGS